MAEEKIEKAEVVEQEIPQSEIKEGAPFAALSYIFGLWILVFIFKKENKFSYFHARQAVVIFFAQAICFVGLFIPIFKIVFALINFFLMLVSLYGIYLALKGERKKIPVVTDIADKFIL